MTRAEIAEIRKELHAAMRDCRATLRAKPLSPKALGAALTRVQRAEQAFVRAVDEYIAANPKKRSRSR